MVDADLPPLTRAPFTWRLAFRLLASPALRHSSAGLVRLARAIAGESTARRLIDRFGTVVVWSNWPRRTPGWINLHAASLYWHLMRAVGPPVSAVSVRAASGPRPRRIGCLGPFSGLLTFQRRFFEAKPAHVELVVYDVAYDERHASYLKPLANAYRAVRLGDGAEPGSALAATITADRLDLLIVVYGKRTAYDLLDRLDVPAVAHICTGSDLLHHDKVSFQIYPQPAADFFPAGDRMFSAVLRQPLGPQAVYPGWILYDPRDLDADAPSRRWHEREPLIVCHGSLWKMASPPFLELVFDLLAEDSQLEFAFMGRDARGVLARIERRARERGVQGRVHYRGAFSHQRNDEGDVGDPGWRELCGLLGRARLAPDPWPVGGGSARFEAYLSGAPTVHMGLRMDEASWGQPQPATIDLPALGVPEATASGPDEYRALCRRALTDAAFADRVADAQRAVARRLGDPHAYWDQILDCHARWFRQSHPQPEIHG